MSSQQRKYSTRPLSTGLSPRPMPRPLVYHKPVPAHSTFGILLRKGLFVVAGLALLVILATLGFKLWIDLQTKSLIYSVDSSDLPKNHVALVFGAGLQANGEPSAILYDRIATGVDLYNSGKVDKLLMTGDNSIVTHNEVEAMRKTAVRLGVPDADIVLDYAGFSTFDSCSRANQVFGLTEATLVTQDFHLPRAIYLCNQLGVQSVGVTADRQPYDTLNNELREYVAVANAGWRILTHDQPHFLGPKVDVDEPQR